MVADVLTEGRGALPKFIFYFLEEQNLNKSMSLYEISIIVVQNPYLPIKCF